AQERAVDWCVSSGVDAIAEETVNTIRVQDTRHGRIGYGNL
ncbi:14140_t:CDS:1, partial [Acaulospora colombiana]